MFASIPYKKILLIALPLAVVTFILGHALWSDAPDMPPMPSALLPHFIFVSAFESLAFGLGVAFALLGWRHVATVKGEDSTLTLATFWSIVWLLVSWWPHDNMHRHNGMELYGLLRIEYLFHVTLIIASAIVALYFWRHVTRAQ